ncbi:hypothetical protein D9756_009127 [Leucocoprinus leucothites]|uniref:Nephrocystin 3-like N-terminal domain-containing protein n=1 Tax=Leucocoprinus leucothites TaxID=201217 RepID=A0A8H5FVD8_9AGAR|nr:hypothetical protein D9756_009127 [Leucoagaricus leucothites]
MPSHILENAQNVLITNSYFIDNSQGGPIVTGKGLQVLFEASVPEAAHDSFARYPPSRCHPETRKVYIEEIITWGQSDQPDLPCILWLKGPAGVGKSAIAQTCAEALGERLAAAFFFSRPNARDDPNRLFTTIAYQLATNNKPYRDILDSLLHDDPSLVTKSIPQQFQYLIVGPLHQLVARGHAFGKKVIIIDGLDECHGIDFQRDIVNIIAASAQYKTTPFLWAFMSRPEPHLTATFTSSVIRHLCHNVEVAVTRDDDQELRQYLRDGLEEIQRERGLPSSWFSEEDLQQLVELAAGLFIYAATVLRFIGQPSALGPEGQLRSVLALYQQQLVGIRTRSDLKHPLSELDLFYTLIIQQIPQEILPVAMKILLATAYFPRYRDIPPALKIAEILGLSESQLQNALCQNLQSVLTFATIKPRDGTPELVIRFYHTSFMEFLHDESRSGRFSLSHAAVSLRKDIFQWLNRSNRSDQAFQSKGGLNERSIDSEIYRGAFRCLLRLCISYPLENDPATLQNLRDFDYLASCSRGQRYGIDLTNFSNNIPRAYRRAIIRPYWSISQLKRRLVKGTDQLYVLGNGKGRVLVKVQSDRNGSVMEPFPSGPITRCMYFFRR